MNRATEKVSTLEKPIYLHSLEAFVEFKSGGKKYRTITHLKEGIVNRTYGRFRRDVLDLQTNKAIRLPYFTEVKKVV